MKKRTQNRKLLYGPAFAAALVSTAVVPVISWAQTADATLRGKAPANSDVTAKNLATGAVRRTKAAEDGSYALVGLSPGTYRIDAGAGTENTVTLSVASTTTLDLVSGSAVAPEGTLEEILVKAMRPVEVKTSEIGATVTQKQIANLPQATRNFLEFADIVPGMAFNIDAQGNTSLRGGAMNNSSVNVFIDGVGQKNYVKEGGVSGQFFTQGNPFPQLAIGEYKVITSNYKAEFDQISSAAITAETKSGTNQIHGEVFGRYTDTGLRGDTPGELALDKKTPSHEDEYGFAVGGPIIQDQLHFFFAYEGKKFNTPITVTPGVVSINNIPIANLLPASAVAQFGPSGLPFRENLYFGKLDWEVSDRDRLELEAKVRREDQIIGIGVGLAASASIDSKNNDTRIVARWKHSADRWFNEFRVTYENAFTAPSAQSLGNGTVYSVASNNDRNVLDTGPADPRGTQNKGQAGAGLQDDLTFSNLQWRGDHTLKMGAKYKLVYLTAQDAENINPQFYYDVETTGTNPLPYRAFFTNPVAGLNAAPKSKDDQFGLYFQDDWAATDRLTWNLGARWDYEKNSTYLDYETPANVVAAINGQDLNAPVGQTYAQSLAKGGVTDYISTGSNRKPYLGEFAPRLGFSFDLSGDQHHVVFGGAGRSYDRDLYDYLQLEQTKSALPQFTYYFQPQCGTHTPCVAWNPAYLNGLSNLQSLVAASNKGAEVDLINNHLKPPYSDQFSVGIRNKVGDWNTSATLARLLSYDGVAVGLGNRRPDGTFFLNGGQPWGNGVPGFGSLIIFGNGIETRSTEVLLSAEKPYSEESGWGTTIAYTYTSAQQNRDIKEHYSLAEAETIKGYPFITSNAAARHRLVVTGTARGPWGLVFGAKLALATPIPVNDVSFNFAPGTYAPSGCNCIPIAGTPPNIIGFRELDLQATENFHLTGDQSAYLRVDVLNVLDAANYSDTIANWGSNGVRNPNPVIYNTTGNLAGQPFKLVLSGGYKF